MEAQESDRQADPADLADLTAPADPAAGPRSRRRGRRPEPEGAPGAPSGASASPKRGTPDPPAGRPLINPRLANDPRARVWFSRIVIAAAVYVGFMIGFDWRFAVSATAIYLITDFAFRSKTTTVIPPSVRVTEAQRSTQRRLRMLQPAGYYALNTCQIPGTQHIIDHLVVGPAGVFAIDSELLDKRLTVHVRGRGQFIHGSVNQIDRINHAKEEAAQAEIMIGAELGEQVQVQPVMVIYGPDVPWKIMQFEGVDIFGGGRIGTYFRRQTRETEGRHLTPERISQIFNAAALALPPLDG